jgi:hypothetical protein
MGGMNEFAYPTNPVRQVDPLGLQTATPSTTPAQTASNQQKTQKALLAAQLQKYYPPTPQTRVPLSIEKTREWLCRAVTAENANIMPAYTYLNAARNIMELDKNDSNLVAAERYMEGYEGNYGKIMIFGQNSLKKMRAFFGTGGNGSPVSDSEYVTTWGFMGVEDHDNNAPVCGSAGIGQCSLTK